MEHLRFMATLFRDDERLRPPTSARTHPSDLANRFPVGTLRGPLVAVTRATDVDVSSLGRRFRIEKDGMSAERLAPRVTEGHRHR